MSNTVIQRGSEAWDELKEIFSDSTSYKVSIEIRAGGVAIKQNEYMWGPTLKVTKEVT